MATGAVAGVLLLLAHNWEHLGRPARTVIAILPLVVSQAIAGWVLVRRGESTAWREGSAAFLALTVGATIGLISQTYQIPGDLEVFLLLLLFNFFFPFFDHQGVHRTPLHA